MVLYVARVSFGLLFIMAISLSLIGSILGLLPFSGVMFTLFRSWSMSMGFSCVSSPILMAVSLIVCRTVAIVLLAPAMSWSISSSVGMNGSRSFAVYLGGFHWIFFCFR